MSNHDFFSDSLSELRKLFPNLKPVETDRIKKLFNETDIYWNTNYGRFINNKEIKYLLICEAPPSNGHYFYKSINDYFAKSESPDHI